MPPAMNHIATLLMDMHNVAVSAMQIVQTLKYAWTRIRFVIQVLILQHVSKYVAVDLELLMVAIRTVIGPFVVEHLR